jgi:hypothetical protein
VRVRIAESSGAGRIGRIAREDKRRRADRKRGTEEWRVRVRVRVGGWN